MKNRRTIKKKCIECDSEELWLDLERKELLCSRCGLIIDMPYHYVGGCKVETFNEGFNDEYKEDSGIVIHLSETDFYNNVDACNNVEFEVYDDSLLNVSGTDYFRSNDYKTESYNNRDGEYKKSINYWKNLIDDFDFYNIYGETPDGEKYGEQESTETNTKRKRLWRKNGQKAFIDVLTAMDEGNRNAGTINSSTLEASSNVNRWVKNIIDRTDIKAFYKNASFEKILISMYIIGSIKYGRTSKLEDYPLATHFKVSWSMIWLITARILLVFLIEYRGMGKVLTDLCLNLKNVNDETGIINDFIASIIVTFKKVNNSKYQLQKKYKLDHERVCRNIIPVIHEVNKRAHSDIWRWAKIYLNAYSNKINTNAIND